MVFAVNMSMISEKCMQGECALLFVYDGIEHLDAVDAKCCFDVWPVWCWFETLAAAFAAKDSKSC